MLPRIFDIFVQAPHSPPHESRGLGVGLSLARFVVERHGGTIEARSEGVGRGSEFVVRLPLARDELDGFAPAGAREDDRRAG
jgi:signal transduction histidine kinase